VAEVAMTRKVMPSKRAELSVAGGM